MKRQRKSGQVHLVRSCVGCPVDCFLIQHINRKQTLIIVIGQDRNNVIIKFICVEVTFKNNVTKCFTHNKKHWAKGMKSKDVKKQISQKSTEIVCPYAPNSWCASSCKKTLIPAVYSLLCPLEANKAIKLQC